MHFKQIKSKKIFVKYKISCIFGAYLCNNTLVVSPKPN